jgi:molybdopterin-guanine dinucleotide biosynthesis adapter protein
MPAIIAVSGWKNFGKTTLITKLIGILSPQYKIAVIKHDGHDFEADVPGTDSYLHKQSGAVGTAVLSDNKFMVVKDWNNKEKISGHLDEKIIEIFQDMDLIFLEGFKYSDYPKIEILRENRSSQPSCKPCTVIAYACDFIYSDPRYIDINDVEAMAKLCQEQIESRANKHTHIITGVKHKVARHIITA